MVGRCTSADAQPSKVRITASGTSASATAARPNSAGDTRRARLTAAAKASTSPAARATSTQRTPAKAASLRVVVGRAGSSVSDRSVGVSKVSLPHVRSREARRLAERKAARRRSVGLVMGTDVVFALFQTSWSGAVARGLCMPEDRLAAALPAHPRVRRSLVVNPPRNVAARWLRPAGAPYPASPGAGAPRAAAAAPRRPRRPRRRPPRRGRLRALAAPRRAPPGPRAARRSSRRIRCSPASATSAGPGRSPTTRGTTGRRREPHRRWWPVYEQAFARLRAARARGLRGLRHRPEPHRAHRPGRGRCPTASTPRSGSSRPVAAGVVLRPSRSPPALRRQPRPPCRRRRRSGGSRPRYPSASITLVGELIEPAHYAPLAALPNVRGPPARRAARARPAWSRPPTPA